MPFSPDHEKASHFSFLLCAFDLRARVSTLRGLSRRKESGGMKKLLDYLLSSTAEVTLESSSLPFRALCPFFFSVSLRHGVAAMTGKRNGPQIRVDMQKKKKNKSQVLAFCLCTGTASAFFVSFLLLCLYSELHLLITSLSCKGIQFFFLNAHFTKEGTTATCQPLLFFIPFFSLHLKSKNITLSHCGRY